MNKPTTIVFSLILLLNTTSLQAQKKCNCEENFKWVKETFEKNDAGSQYAIQQNGLNAYTLHNDTILAKVKKVTTSEQCTEIIHAWLTFFRKDHLAISPIYNTQKTNDASGTSWPTINISEDAVKNQMPQAPVTFEGIWQSGDYSIGIIKKDDQFKGVILSSSNKTWSKNDVKIIINKDSSALFYRDNHAPEKFDKAFLIGKNTLKLGYIYLKRIYPAIKENDTMELFTTEMTTTLPFIQKLSNKTVLLRIPTFKGTAKRHIDSVITANSQLLKSTVNLIIDIRNNGGGSDESYDNILPLIYTNPIRTQKVMMYATKLNNQRMLDFYNNAERYGFSEQTRQWAKKSYAVLERHIGEFVNLDSGKSVSVLTLDSIFPLPKSVAIVINENNGSSAEQFLLAVRQSKKIKLFGKTTAGVLDISNMYFVDSPDKQFNLGYGLSKSLRIPDMAIDGKGIMPDYYMDKTIPETQWINFVQTILEE